MTTTAFALDGYRVVKNLGVVRGIIVRSRSIFGTIGAGLQTLVGGNISIFTDLCEQTRRNAIVGSEQFADRFEITADGLLQFSIVDAKRAV